jgi:hypothetical protein
VVLNLLLNIDVKRLQSIPASLPPAPFGTAQHVCAAPRDMCSSIHVSTTWPGFAPLMFILHSTSTISKPLPHLVHHIRHCSFPCGALLFPLISSYCHSNFILIHCELTSIPTLYISQIEPDDIGVEFGPFASPK